jgi:riboflavin synthase alpha subunit
MPRPKKVISFTALVRYETRTDAKVYPDREQAIAHLQAAIGTSQLIDAHLITGTVEAVTPSIQIGEPRKRTRTKTKPEKAPKKNGAVIKGEPRIPPEAVA